MTNIILIIIASLLGILCLIGVGVYLNTSETERKVSNLVKLFASLHDLDAEERLRVYEEVKSILDDMADQGKETGRAIEDIQQVMDIIYQYKLPNKTEREQIDKIKFDSETLGRTVK